MKQTTALALFSGGLDSILSCRLVASQSIRVQAIKFVSPFFDYSLLEHQGEYERHIKDRYDIDVNLVDVSDGYLELLKNPAHGFGKNFNPCVDCKIFLFSNARRLMPEFGASFLITGEVLGQRPMSQRRDTLRVIERDSGCENILVRPLCARNLEPTQPELSGLINRDLLLDFSGRTRAPQIELARSFGIEDYPSPAGGCILTDPVLSKRIRDHYREHDIIRVADIRMLLVGRQFKLARGGRLALGRNMAENDKIETLRQPGDIMLVNKDRPGPSALLRFSVDPEDLRMAAGLVVRYSKKLGDSRPECSVAISSDNQQSEIHTGPVDDQIFRPLML